MNANPVIREETDELGAREISAVPLERLPRVILALLPFRVMPFELGMLIDAFQVAVHDAGSVTVSPLDAELTAFCTSDCEQLLADTVAARAEAEANPSKTTRAHPAIFNMLTSGP